MGKALIIAEKPSVAADIARALGGFVKQGDYYESPQYVLAAAAGHLLEIHPPEGVEVTKGKWTLPHLPVIPPHFELRPIEKGQARLKVLTQLIKRKDVTSLINACDAGREGELIFRNLVRYSGVNKPIQRLWLQSMTPAAIREGFARLRTDQEMQPLADAAICRSEADWLVGINGTRAMTAFNSKTGGFMLTTVGRVQTPTLAMLVEREKKIREFVPRTYWEVMGTFQAQSGEYTGRWFDEKFVRKEDDSELKPERLWDVKRAEELRNKCLGKPGIVTEESKPTTQLSPLLFDLTSLQRDANSRFGFSAQQTLSVAQALYEKHKVITYPRTDSRHLPEDYQKTVISTLEMLRGDGSETSGDYSQFAASILENRWVRPNKRIFDNSKISDHFAIIPTTLRPKHLNEAESKIYDLVVRRFLAVFYPAAEFLVTTRITRVEGEPFKSEGKVLVKPGWLVVYGRQQNSEEAAILAPVQPNERVMTSEVEIKENQTKPPPRFSEATLLTAMETAGKLVEDDELREAMEEKGLGTPATRAQIIEGLIYEKYIVRRGRELQPTAKAFSLMALLNALGVPELTKPELTGHWEFKLRQMERRQLQRSEFMRQIAELTRHIVDKVKRYEGDTIPGEFGELKVPCPKCGGLIKETYRNFQCQKCDFSLWKTVAGRQLETEEAETLLRDKVVGPLAGFRSQKGFKFNAVLRLSPEFKVEFDFGNGSQNQKNDEKPPDFSGQEPVGKCPKCGARVFENGANYVCEKAVGAGRTCDFRAGMIILQRRIERSEMAKLLAEGKSDLLKNFISKRNGRPFEAYLVLDKDGNVGFEFAKRTGKPKKTSDKPKTPPQPVDFSSQTPLGKCPLCGGNVFETETFYVCEKSQASKKPCKFKVGKVILNQSIDRAQITKLLAEGRTDLLTGFVSRKSGKPFSAFLKLQDGKVEFEFPERDSNSG